MANNRLPHKQRSIEKIRNAKVLERLIKHFNGEIELSTTQTNVGLSLIKKYLPDQKAVEHSGAIGGEKPASMSEAALDREIERQLARASARKEAETES